MIRNKTKYWLFLFLFAFAFSFSLAFTQEGTAMADACCSVQHPCGGQVYGHWVGGTCYCTPVSGGCNHFCPFC